MGASLDGRAREATEAMRALERALADARTQWNDATRQSFDQRYIEPLLAAGRRAERQLADLAKELHSAVVELERAG